MYLSRLSLQNYRNYAREELIPHRRINILYGENAQGKSNLLEAIFLLATGKSPRNARDQEMARWGKTGIGSMPISSAGIIHSGWRSATGLEPARFYLLMDRNRNVFWICLAGSMWFSFLQKSCSW